MCVFIYLQINSTTNEQLIVFQNKSAEHLISLIFIQANTIMARIGVINLICLHTLQDQVKFMLENKLSLLICTRAINYIGEHIQKKLLNT